MSGPSAVQDGQARFPTAAVLACSCGLSGCTSGPQGYAPWGFIALAFVLACAAWFALGLSRARGRMGRDLRLVRGELRRLGSLQRGWHWETDREHRLRAWRAPAVEPPGVEREAELAQAGRALFGAGMVSAEGLRSYLRAERPFAGLHVRTTDAQWVIDGVPRVDDQGRFAGFVGQARALQPDDELGANADTLRQMLAAFAGPALLAVQQTDRWVLRFLNPAAQAYWPHMGPGSNLSSAWDGLPDTFASALEVLAGGASVEATGWRMTRLRSAIGRSLVVIARTGAAPDGSEELALTLSHDLRAPIRVVEGFTRIVKEDYGQRLDRVGNEHLDRVLGAVARMNLMIDALLAMARLSVHPLTHQPVNLSQLAGFVVEDLRRGQPERNVEVQIEPELTAEGDPTLLRMVLENLLGNAWKYTGRTPAAHISLHRVQAGGRAAFAVADNGAGFDMRSADRLFGLFQRLHSANDFAGHGVGLASVRRIVQRHGGQIWAQAEPGAGATFTFTLA